jgi:hypothetical protein
MQIIMDKEQSMRLAAALAYYGAYYQSQPPGNELMVFDSETLLRMIVALSSRVFRSRVEGRFINDEITSVADDLRWAEETAGEVSPGFDDSRSPMYLSGMSGANWTIFVDTKETEEIAKNTVNVLWDISQNATTTAIGYQTVLVTELMLRLKTPGFYVRMILERDFAIPDNDEELHPLRGLDFSYGSIWNLAARGLMSYKAGVGLENQHAPSTVFAEIDENFLSPQANKGDTLIEFDEFISFMYCYSRMESAGTRVLASCIGMMYRMTDPEEIPGLDIVLNAMNNGTLTLNL